MYKVIIYSVLYVCRKEQQEADVAAQKARINKSIEEGKKKISVELAKERKWN